MAFMRLGFYICLNYLEMNTQLCSASVIIKLISNIALLWVVLLFHCHYAINVMTSFVNYEILLHDGMDLHHSAIFQYDLWWSSKYRESL